MAQETIEGILYEMVEAKASDLYIKVGSPVRERAKKGDSLHNFNKFRQL